MRRWYNILRVGGYAAGLAGGVLFVFGARQPALRVVGGVLLMAMVAAFLATYILYVAAVIRRKP